METIYVIGIVVFIVFGVVWLIKNDFNDFYNFFFKIDNKVVRIGLAIIAVICMLFLYGAPYK